MRKVITTFFVLFFVIVGGFFIYKNVIDKPRGFVGRPDFQLDNSTKEEITHFFNVTSDISEIQNYCENNREYCMYYCMEINRDHEICEISKDMRNREPPE